MRRSSILAPASIALSVLLSVAFAGSAAAGAERRSSIPTGFRAQSLTWVSPSRGWMLGVGPCGADTCTTVLGTTNGGGTWNALATLTAPLTSEMKRGVSQIRFADPLHGWIFGPALWATNDGGVKWKKQTPPGGGRLVPELAADSAAVYAVVSPCRLNQAPSRCQPTVWRTAAGAGAWTQVSLRLPFGSVTNRAVLAVHGVAAYLVVPSESPHGDVLDATVDGRHWSSRPDPCNKAKAEALIGVAAISDTDVALLCEGSGAPSQAEKRVFRSNDAGETTSPAGHTPLEGIESQIAAAPNGTLVVSSWGAAGSWIYRNSGGRKWTTPVSLADQGEGWNDIMFTTNRVGFVVYGPAAVYPGTRVGELAETRNRGVTWAPV
jgi:hypothetical protein